MSSEKGPSLNCSCVSEAPIPIHGMIDAHAYHSGWNTWPLNAGLRYVRSNGESISLADIVGTKLPCCEHGKMLTVAKGGHLVKKNTQMYNSNKSIYGRIKSALLEDGIPSLIVTTTLDTEFAHFEGYEGKIIEIGATEKFSAWADQIAGTEMAATLHPLRLFPLFSYDPRRYRRPDKKFCGDDDCKDWDAPFANIVGCNNAIKGIKKIWFGFCMNPTLGFRPFDEFCEHLPDFYHKCEKNNIPILANCASGGITLSNVKKYKDMKNEERAKKSKIRHNYIKEKIRENKPPQDFPREALDSNSYCGKDGSASASDLAMFYANYGHPKNWVPVLRYFPKLRLCVSGFDVTAVWQYLFEERAANGVMLGREWVNCIKKLTRFENVYADISGLDINEKDVRIALYNMLDMVQKGYKELEHLKYKLIFGSGWYLTHLIDLNSSVDYSGYCGMFKRIFNTVDKSGKLWERVSLVNPWNFYGFGHKINDMYSELNSYNGKNVNTDMLKKMKEVFGNSIDNNMLVSYISAYNKKNPVVKSLAPDENDTDLVALKKDLPCKLDEALIHEAIAYVENNSTYKDKNGDPITACNISIQYIFKKITKSTALEGMLANRMYEYLEEVSSPTGAGSFKRIDINNEHDFKTIQELANQGNIIIGAWKDMSGKPGHVVMVVPGKGLEKGNWKIGDKIQFCDLPVVMDTGSGARKNGKQIRKLSLSFTQDMHMEVKFFIYIPQ